MASSTRAWGLGYRLRGSQRVSAHMLCAADAVAFKVDPRPVESSLLPTVENLSASSAGVAVAVVEAALEEGTVTRRAANVVQAAQNAMWYPHNPSVS